MGAAAKRSKTRVKRKCTNELVRKRDRQVTKRRSQRTRISSSPIRNKKQLYNVVALARSIMLIRYRESYRKVENLYHVPRSTLADYVVKWPADCDANELGDVLEVLHSMQINDMTLEGRRLMSDVTEIALFDWIERAVDAFVPVSRSVVIEKARQLIHQQSGTAVDGSLRRWYERFVDKYRLTIRPVENCKVAHVLWPDRLPQIANYFNILTAFADFAPHRLWAGDETSSTFSNRAEHHCLSKTIKYSTLYTDTGFVT